jgi:hypothetical protein
LHGATIEKFNPSELQEKNDYTLKSMCLELLEISPVMFPTKKKICYVRLSSDHQRDKSQVGILNRFYPGTEIIKDIGRGLNFRKKGLYPFWTKFIQEKSKKLLPCTTTDCEDLVLNSWNSSAKRLLAGSWFIVKLTEVNKQSPVNSLKSCPSSLFSLPKTIDSAVGTEKEGKKSKKAKNWKKKSTKKNQQRKLKKRQGKTL